MSLLVITASQVFGSGVTEKIVTVGETVTQGEVLYRQTSDGVYYKARSDVAATAAADGIALTAGSAGQRIVIADLELEGNLGSIDLGATLAPGMVYVISTVVSGGIMPITDMGTSAWIVVLGISDSSDNLILDVIDPEAQTTVEYT